MAASRIIKAVQPATILIVEDQEPIRRFVGCALSKAGYVTLEAGTGHHAVAIINEHVGPIALVILDIIMPGLGGLDVANELARRRPETQVLYISGRIDSIAVQSIASFRPAALLPKPFTAHEVVERVRQVLHGPTTDSELADAK